MKNNILHVLTTLTLALTALTQIGCSAKVENDPGPKLFDYTNENPTKPLDLTFSTDANPIDNTFTITNTATDTYDVIFDFTAPSTQQYAIFNAKIVYSGCDASLPKSTEYLAKNDGNGNLDIIPTDLMKPFELIGGQKYSFLIHLENIKSCSLLQYSFALVEKGVVAKPAPTPTPTPGRQVATSFKNTKFISCENSSAKIEVNLGICNLEDDCYNHVRVKYNILTSTTKNEYQDVLNYMQMGSNYTFSIENSSSEYVEINTNNFNNKKGLINSGSSRIDSIPCEFYQ